MLSHLRRYVGPIKRLLAYPFLVTGASPLLVSAFGVVMAALASLLGRIGWHDCAFWLALVAVLTDLVDGEVARATDSCSPSGNYFDALGDRTRECILLLGLLPLAPNLVALALAGSCLTSFAKARVGLVIVSDNRDWPGFGDHPDRAVLILIAYLFCPNVSPALCLLVLLSWTCFGRRLLYARDLIESADGEEILPYLRGD